MLACTFSRSLSATGLLLLVAAPLRADTLKVPSTEFATIQAALDVAQAGDVVQVSKGVYAENVTIVTSGITLKGKGATINGRYLGSCVTVSADDVRVESLVLANGGEPPALDGNPDGGLYAFGTGITLSKLTVVASADFGLRLDGTGSVQSCKVDACAGDGIVVDTGNSASPTVTLISKNTVTRCGDGIFATNGPFTVDGNSCSQNRDSGITVEITPPIADGEVLEPLNRVTKNKCLNNLGDGMTIFQDDPGGLGVQVEKNTLQANDVGLSLYGSFIFAVANTVQDSTEDGVFLAGSECVLEKTKVLRSGGRGIHVSFVPMLAQNTLTGNTVQDNGRDGIVVETDGNTIDNSTVKDNGGDGIEMELGADHTILMLNKVSGNQHDGIDNSGLDALIFGNQCKTNGGADLAGAGDGAGTVDLPNSTENTVSDGSELFDFSTPGELDLPQ